MEIGRMLDDIAFLPDGNRATFFNATLVNGVLETDPAVVLTGENRREEVLRCSYRR